ncbi:hypothetical protein DUI87_02786 [Hirundo rustica rustica]|uniref:Uncharacterized protein n=1 Tax=Hirundo rustica rustica TaxID=333673 RepID=A0A3M0L969_HIRRU|nr:hypothetical protein DUI87_02786 [Hirundo rustica rustica]
MVRDDGAAEEDQDMSVTDDDIIRITASEGIPVRKAKALEFSLQASSFLLSKDFMKQFFQQFTEAASEFQHDPMSSFSQIFLPRKGAAEKFDDAQQSLVPVLQEKEKQTKQDEVQPQKQVDPGKDEAAAKTANTAVSSGVGQDTGFWYTGISCNRLDGHKEICIERGDASDGFKGHGYASDL